VSQGGPVHQTHPPTNMQVTIPLTTWSTDECQGSMPAKKVLSGNNLQRNSLLSAADG
jgi:hypothetical protein